MEPNEKQVHPQSLRAFKIIQVIFILAVLAYLGIILRIPQQAQVSIDGSTRNLITIILSIFLVITFAFSYFLPNLLIRAWIKRPRKIVISMIFIYLQLVQVVQASLFEASAIYGLILGFLGVSLEIIVIFFAVSMIGLLLTFPTRAKWERKIAKIKPLLN